MEDLGRLVILDYVLTGNNLNQCGSHLSQIEREQARILLHNQRDQMRQRLCNAMLAAYGVSTMYAEAIDTSHDLGEHFYALTPTLTLQPPVGASLKEALNHLCGQALAHQFPAHPQFVEEVRRPALRRLLELVRQATRARDGRVEVERPYRDEVRRIAVPLRLGDMGETHFVLRDDWQSHFLRKQAEEGATSLTVRSLRAWIDQPEAMGLPREVQNLVILSFALQSNLTFYSLWCAGAAAARTARQRARITRPAPPQRRRMAGSHPACRGHPGHVRLAPAECCQCGAVCGDGATDSRAALPACRRTL